MNVATDADFHEFLRQYLCLVDEEREQQRLACDHMKRIDARLREELTMELHNRRFTLYILRELQRAQWMSTKERLQILKHMQKLCNL